MTHLKVAVRVRPMSQREYQDGSVPVIEVEDKNTIAITNLKVPEDNAGDSRQRVRRFSFDFCFSENATQTDVFDVVSAAMAPALRARQNCCVLAYGQSSSGKTHTMLGRPGDAGLAPRLCETLFEHLRAAAVGDELRDLAVLVSYLEIYNEKVTDLLRPEEDLKDSKPPVPLRIREHPKKGPYVQGLTEHSATEPAALLRWLGVGTSRRRAAATPRNPRSSRSHAVVRLSCAGARLHLVDLAGSEKAIGRCYSRFREGANINKSLVALGNVISALGEPAAGEGPRQRRQHRRPAPFVPFRDSALTWLLRDTLAGDSNTLLVATVSPAGQCHAESLNTLRFGQRARRVVSRPVLAVREDAAHRVVRELRAEVARLREQLRLAAAGQPTVRRPSHAMSDTSTAEASDQIDDLTSSTDSSATYVVSAETGDKSVAPVTATATLVPVMKVLSAVKPSVTALRRTFSVDRQIIKMEKEKYRSFSSQESLQQSPKHVKRKSLPSLKNSPNTSPRESLTGKSKNGTSSTQQSPSRVKPALATVNPALKTIVQRRMLESAAGKAIVEAKNAAASKQVEVSRKPPAKPRAQIVAAVTSRLYNKANKKEVATETDPIGDTNVLKEATICSNARLKLIELTQRALKAHRRKNAETQTQNRNFPTKRLKEIATDVNDLKLKAKVVRNAETNAKPDTRDESTECKLLDDDANRLSLTRTCGTQCDQKHPFPFVKYLGYAADGPPIYAETVNINIAHNYASGSVSDDSLDQPAAQNVAFPTPDLISNHNSLEPHGEDGKLRFAATRSVQEQTEVNAMFASEDRAAAAANVVVVPKREQLQKVFQQLAHASERLVFNEFTEKCEVLKVTPAIYARARVVEIKGAVCDSCVVVNEPLVRKSIIKSNPTKTAATFSSSSEEELVTIGDSLEYHKANAKKVQFRSKRCAHGRMQKAMSNFLEEASILIGNLSMAASRIDAAATKPLLDDSYEIQVTLNDRELTKQTLFPDDNCSQASDSLPINRYEALLRDSCARLEERIDKTLSKSMRRREYAEDAERFAQPLSLHPWNLEVREDSSLESNPVTHSDYGSLPRRASKRQRTATCSPSAFLRQLANTRRQIVESSREDLMGGAAARQ